MKKNINKNMELIMRKLLFFAIGTAIFLSAALTPQSLQAQVFTFFEDVNIRYDAPYQELSPVLEDVKQATEFWLYPNPNMMDNDDGYTRVDIGFDFDYNGTVYNSLWINVNGFVTFNNPLATRANTSVGLFEYEPSTYPGNVIAPYWGDHYYRLQDERFDGWMPSKISVYLDETPGSEVFTIQWKDLNINDKTIRSSVGNFQLKLYKSQTPASDKGNIEFCYGTVGGNPYTQLNEVITRKASVGIKGIDQFLDEADFMNGLFFGWDKDYAITNDTENTGLDIFTNEWPPSGATDRRIVFQAIPVVGLEEWWGDGDVDFSKAEGQRDFGRPQNIFVSINDARLIMKAVARDEPLDSVRKRTAYHGDVNHDGRFYYNNQGQRTDIPWKDEKYFQNLPPGISSISRVFYQANEYDAAMIIHYLGARIPELPWLYDWPQYGKFTPENVATGIRFGEVVTLPNGNLQVPVSLNGSFEGPVAMKFDMNSNVVNINNINVDGNIVSSSFHDGNVVVVGSGAFNANQVMVYVEFTSEDAEIDVTGVRFNGKEVENLILSAETSADEVFSMINSPNPFTANTLIQFNVVESGAYKLEIYDMVGNVVRTLLDSELNAGLQSEMWDGLDENGNKVESGVYVYRLTGNNTNVSRTMIFNK